MAKLLKDKSVAELEKQLKEAEGTLANFRFGGAGAKVSNVKLGRNTRRTIAQIKTVLQQKKHDQTK